MCSECSEEYLDTDELWIQNLPDNQVLKELMKTKGSKCEYRHVQFYDKYYKFLLEVKIKISTWSQIWLRESTIMI